MNNKILTSSFFLFLSYALILVLGGDALLSCLLSLPLFSEDELRVEFYKVLIAFLPFGFWILLWAVLYKFKGSQVNLRAYRFGIFTGLGISLAIWGYYFYDSIFPGLGGANIGLGLMLLFSPIYIFVFMLVTWGLSKGSS